MTTAITPYIGVTVEGGLLPASLLERLAAGSRDLPGARPQDYHLAASEGIGDAASRKWLYLRGVYLAFRDVLKKLQETDPATSETRQNWLLILLNELGFGQVPYQRGGFTVGEKTYPISHVWEHVREHVPVHLVGWHTDLDRRSGYGERGRAPQSMLQEFLNVSDDHLWGILANGRRLRLLRDSNALVGSSYVEFDLEAIFDGELYSDFLLLFMLVHESRFELQPRDDDTPPTQADCWLERWRVDAVETGTRALDHLRDGVQAALEELGTGFLEANQDLSDDLQTGRLTASDYRHELLRLIYQIIFLLVAEGRGGLHDPAASPEAIDAYQRYFSATRLRRIARRRGGDRNSDLWRTLVLVFNALGDDDGSPALGLPGLGGLFFRGDVIRDTAGDAIRDTLGSAILVPGGEPDPDPLRRAELRNDRLLAAIRHLDEIADARGRPQRVDYQHLGAEELGSIYESLLELEPYPDTANLTFTLVERPGNARKTTGSYYTPRPLVETLIDSTLNPLIDKAARSGDPDELLKLTVCDPACGSGGFLVAAARRIAIRYAAIKSGDEEPTPRAVSDAMHEVVRRCVYGVDVSELAVELAKVSLWLESLRPGKPLAFLDGHLKVGNSLLGTTPKLLGVDLPDGIEIPDAAFNPITGDDRKVALALRRQNEKERGAQFSLFDVPKGRVGDIRLATRARELAARPVMSLSSIRAQIREFRALESDPVLRRRKQVANAWCAAFVWRKRASTPEANAPEAITTELLRRMDDEIPLPDDVAKELEEITRQYKFFHWHLEFLDVFREQEDEAADANPDTGWQGGFSCVLGNPPWERVKLQEQEFFGARRPEIAKARNAAARKRAIDRLATSEDETDRRLYDEFQRALREADGWSQLLRESGRYPLTGRGDVNTYAVFAEAARTVIAPAGRSGLVLPTGIGTDATTAPFFSDLVSRSELVSFLEFENESFLLSRAVDHRVRFCLLSMSGRRRDEPDEPADFAFRVRYIAELPDRRFTMPARDLLLVNPNTGTTPLFRTRRDAQITFDIYRRVPVLWRDDTDENPWGIAFLRMFDMATDARLFQTMDELVGDGWELDGNTFLKSGKRMLPLYEAKMVHQFDHRYGTYAGQTEAQANVGTLPRPASNEKSDPNYVIMPRYWVQEWSVKNEKKSKPGKPVYDIAGVDVRLESRNWDKGWLLGWRDIARSSDERTIISSLIPRVAVGDKYLLALAERSSAALQANLSSFVLDFCARQKHAGASFKYYLIKQLPVLSPDEFSKPVSWSSNARIADWITPRVLELTYTAWDMESFALDLGDNGPPFVWDDERRFTIRAELDAALFHLYEINRGDADYIMDTFPVVKRRDEERFNGDYRTKRTILEIYDAMADATRTGVPFRSVLDPAPGNGARHRARKPSETW